MGEGEWLSLVSLGGLLEGGDISLLYTMYRLRSRVIYGYSSK